MKKLIFVIAMSAAAMGCASAKAPVNGWIYNETADSSSVSSNALGSKTGEACATSILGVVATGDASVSMAAKAAGIKNISYVDYKSQSILGVYAKYCTVVHGN